MSIGLQRKNPNRMSDRIKNAILNCKTTTYQKSYLMRSSRIWTISPTNWIWIWTIWQLLQIHNVEIYTTPCLKCRYGFCCLSRPVSCCFQWLLYVYTRSRFCALFLPKARLDLVANHWGLGLDWALSDWLLAVAVPLPHLFSSPYNLDYLFTYVIFFY